MKKFLLGLSISVLVIFSAMGGALADRLFVIKPLDALTKRVGANAPVGTASNKVLTEENVTIDVADKSSPSVVTVAIIQPQAPARSFTFDPFGNMFGFPGMQQQQQQGQGQQTQQDIGTGFVVDNNMIVTNKHVVADTQSQYKIIDNNNKEYTVSKIYRDPSNDLALLQVDIPNLKPLALGDSNNLKVGQYVVAIGTALGQFRHTVTTGVISGLGRGIQAGDPLAGAVEHLDNVIQTSAAINPGNSGGPLINSAGQVIGVNVAVAENAQSVGFAIPINVIKDSLSNFRQTGSFNRPQFGVQYQMVTREAAILNEVPQGAYVRGVLTGSSAEGAGIKVGDIITEVDGQKVSDLQNGLADIINKKKVGDQVKVTYWRDGKSTQVTATLKESQG